MVLIVERILVTVVMLGSKGELMMWRMVVLGVDLVSQMFLEGQELLAFFS